MRAERVAALLDGFDQIWDALVPEERRELLHLLVREVVVDLGRGGLRRQPFSAADLEREVLGTPVWGSRGYAGVYLP